MTSSSATWTMGWCLFSFSLVNPARFPGQISDNPHGHTSAQELALLASFHVLLPLPQPGPSPGSLDLASEAIATSTSLDKKPAHPFT